MTPKRKASEPNWLLRAWAAAESRLRRVKDARALDTAWGYVGARPGGLRALKDEVKAAGREAASWVDAVQGPEELWYDRQVRQALLEEMLELADGPKAPKGQDSELEAALEGYRRCLRAAVVVARLELGKPPPTVDHTHSHRGPVRAERCNDLCSLDATRMHDACAGLQSGGVTEDPERDVFVGRDLGLEGFDPSAPLLRGEHGDRRQWVHGLYADATGKFRGFVQRGELAHLPPRPPLPQRVRGFADWAAKLTDSVTAWLADLEACRVRRGGAEEPGRPPTELRQKLTRMMFDLVELMWNREEASGSEVFEEVWGEHDADEWMMQRRLKQLIYRVNLRLSKRGIDLGWSLHSKGGCVIKQMKPTRKGRRS